MDNMDEVIITVKGGRIEEIFSKNANISVEVLDFDTQDPEKLEELQARYDEIQKDTSYQDVY